MKKLKNTIIYIVLFFLLSLIIYNIKDIIDIKNSNSDDQLTISYIDVGQGNSVLIQDGDKNMIIDGGDRAQSSKVISFLEQRNINTIDYLVASHYDSDHISGLVGIFNKFKVKNVLNPDYTKDTKIFRSYKNQRDRSKAKVIIPRVGDKFNLNNSNFTIVGPQTYNFSEDNDRSIVIKLEYGDRKFLFPGDAAKESESAMIYSGINLKSDVLMVGHHGSKYSTNDFFLDEVNPKIAVISVGKNNRYNHPSDKVLKKLEDRGIKVLRTDKMGDIILKTDGRRIEINHEK